MAKQPAATLFSATMSPYSSPSARSQASNLNKALIRMAQDFLTTSVDIERAFSHGGGMVTKRRHALRLSAETIRANSLVASWTKEKLVPLAQRCSINQVKTRRYAPAGRPIRGKPKPAGAGVSSGPPKTRSEGRIPKGMGCYPSPGKRDVLDNNNDIIRQQQSLVFAVCRHIWRWVTG
ncbi:hypothetical protein GGX14DRAFT_402918 [Mycena pura]|uniref:HAT C-terminal dimerisation domain-containing protein n=1 Tax=Mycena pura TaxID=153505 RepID=A0AAD6V138_9AGAR|nr:hypothetical protein GGX14DRAFT_402918 [Mycena pura]